MIKMIVYPVLILTLAACGTKEYHRPDTALSAGQDKPQMIKENDAWRGKQWWKALNDPYITDTVGKLLLENLEIKQAVSRVFIAESIYRQAGGALLPALTADITGQRSRIAAGEERGGASFQTGQEAFYRNTYSPVLNLSWQLDLFGKVRQEKKYQEIQYNIAQAEADSIRHTLIASVVMQRVNWAVGRNHIVLQRQMIDNLENTLSLVQNRYRLGMEGTSSADILLAKQNLLDAQASLPALEADYKAILSSLDVLLAQPIGTHLKQDDERASIPPDRNDFNHYPDILPLLDNRPDLQADELRVKAAHVNRNIALTSLYPDVSLAGTVGWQSEKLNNLFTADQMIGSLLGKISAFLFSGGRLQAGIDLSEAQYEEKVAAYRQKVLTAWREVDTAFTQIDYYRKEYDITQKAVQNAHVLEKIMMERYSKGLIPVLDLLQVKSQRFSAEIKHLTSQRKLWKARIDLYLALGGQWVEN